MPDEARKETSSNTLPFGVILAGGLSRRMGGQEKSLIDLAGKPLLQHVADRLGAQTAALAINANGDGQRFAALGLPVFPDTVEGFAGPLAGILAGMRHAGTHHETCKNIITAAADTPFFPMTLVEKLNQLANGTNAIILARSNGRRHPVFGIWPVALADDLEKFLVEEQGRKVVLFAERYKLVEVEFDNIEIAGQILDPFFNINEPADLEIATGFING